ncbi:MAG: hypothetical protein O3B13_12750 [Planctomycetota bacterium]|nr:hypothetical protein [Planctomycetota bacterium]
MRQPQRITEASSLLLILVAASLGCGGDDPNAYIGPPRVAVTGTVTLGGQPLESGTLKMIPEDETLRKVTAQIQAGAFTIPEPNGPNVGTYRVEISSAQATGETKTDASGETIEVLKEVIPSQYNEESELSAEIKKGENELKFELEG